MGIYDGHTCPHVRPAMVTETVQFQQLYRMAVKSKRKVIHPKLADVTQMLGDAEKKVEIKQEQLILAKNTIDSLAGEIDRFQKERACQYMVKAHSKDFVGRKKPTDSELTKKYRALEKELAVSNKKVKDLTRAMKGITRDVETVFELMKDGKAGLGKICTALKIKLGIATSKVEELTKENKTLKHLNKKLEDLKCPNKTNHLQTATTLSALAKKCTTNTANTPILKEKPSPGSNKRRAEETKAVSDTNYELEKENDEHVGIKVESMTDYEANTLMILNKLGELDSDEDEFDDNDDAPDNDKVEKNATSIDVEDAGGNNETATEDVNVRDDNDDAPDNDEVERNATSINVEDTGGNSETTTEEVSVRSKGHKISARKYHKCNVCEKVCRDSGKLKRHMTVHSVKSYTCNKCEKPFARKDTLKRHLIGWYKNGKYSKGCSVQETSPSSKNPPKDTDNKSIEAGTGPSGVSASVHVNISDTDAGPEVKLEGDDPIQVTPEIDPEYEAGGETSDAVTKEPRKLAGGKNLERDHRVTGPANGRIVSVLQGAAPGLVIRSKRRKVGH